MLVLKCDMTDSLLMDGVEKGRPKKLFIFVNPYGGKRSASKLFMNDVKPILEDANVEFTLQGLFYLRLLRRLLLGC